MPSPTKSWTVLAYIVCRDRTVPPPSALDRAATAEIARMIHDADLEQIHLGIQIYFKKTNQVIRRFVTPEDQERIRRRSAQANPPQGLHQPHMQDFQGDTDAGWPLVTSDWEPNISYACQNHQISPTGSAGDPKMLKDFVEEARSCCPAKHYALFIYGHGYGPSGMFYDAGENDGGAKQEPNQLGLHELREALSDASIDLLMLRSCFMALAETVCELQGVVPYIVATQAEAAIRGRWPWKDIFDLLAAAAGGSEAGLRAGRGIIDRLGIYFDNPHNRGPFRDVPYTLLDTRSAALLTEPLGRLSRTLVTQRLTPNLGKEIEEVFENARRAPSRQHNSGDAALVDLHALAKNLAATHDPEFTDIARGLRHALDGIIKRHRAQEPDFYGGLSIYYKPPDEQIAKDQSWVFFDMYFDVVTYMYLELSRNARWDLMALAPLGSDLVGVL